MDENLQNMSPEDAPFIRKEAFEWFDSIVFSVIAVVIALSFVFRIVGVDGTSMVPTLANSDRVVMWELGYQPTTGDIVVVTKLQKPLIKRIIATGGQAVDIDFEAGVVYVDGVALDEPYVNEPTHRKEDVSFPLVVPEGYVFIMGDNRNWSSDSRTSTVGFVDERYVLGKVIFRILPLSQIGKI